MAKTAPTPRKKTAAKPPPVPGNGGVSPKSLEGAATRAARLHSRLRAMSPSLPPTRARDELLELAATLDSDLARLSSLAD